MFKDKRILTIYDSTAIRNYLRTVPTQQGARVDVASTDQERLEMCGDEPDDRREVKKCYDLGCNVYITKPVDYEQFCEAIRKLGLFLSVVTIPNGE